MLEIPLKVPLVGLEAGVVSIERLAAISAKPLAKAFSPSTVYWPPSERWTAYTDKTSQGGTTSDQRRSSMHFGDSESDASLNHRWPSSYERKDITRLWALQIEQSLVWIRLGVYIRIDLLYGRGKMSCRVAVLRSSYRPLASITQQVLLADSIQWGEFKRAVAPTNHDLHD